VAVGGPDCRPLSPVICRAPAQKLRENRTSATVASQVSSPSPIWAKISRGSGL
jgi:hypothetical protein